MHECVRRLRRRYLRRRRPRIAVFLLRLWDRLLRLRDAVPRPATAPAVASVAAATPAVPALDAACTVPSAFSVGAAVATTASGASAVAARCVATDASAADAAYRGAERRPF